MHTELNQIKVSSLFQKRKFQEALSLDMADTVIHAMQIQKNLILALMLFSRSEQ